MSKKILFLMSGSIACYKACHVISRLKQKGHEVKVATTPSALNFIGKATLEGLTGEKVFTDIYEDGQMMNHIHLSRWADMAILCPATANTINELAHGLSKNAVGTLFLSWDFKNPFIIAPAMNPSMLNHPTTKWSLGRLKEMGVTLFNSDEGHHACGETGEGRLMEPDLILKNLESYL